MPNTADDVVETCRSEIFAILRTANVSDDIFAAVSASTYKLKKAIAAIPSSVGDAEIGRERLARALRPELWTGDPHDEHRAASPESVDAAREGALLKADAILRNLTLSTVSETKDEVPTGAIIAQVQSASSPLSAPQAVHRSDCAVYNETPGSCDCHLSDPSVPAPEHIERIEHSEAYKDFLKSLSASQVGNEERERANAVLQRHLAKQGFGGSDVRSGYYYRRDQLCIDAMLEFAALTNTAQLVEALRKAQRELEYVQARVRFPSIPSALTMIDQTISQYKGKGDRI